MEKRKYRKIRELLPIIEGKRAAGQSYSEIEKEMGLEGDRPIHNLLKANLVLVLRPAEQCIKTNGFSRPS